MFKKNLTLFLFITGAMVASCDYNSMDRELNESAKASGREIGGTAGMLSCVCPSPTITIFDPWPGDPTKNCNTTSSGLYSFSVTGTMSGDVISWAGNSNVNVQNGQGTSSIAAYIYNTSANFTVTCTVTRNCGRGTTYVRTATYASNISQQCQYYQQSTSGDCGLILD